MHVLMVFFFPCLNKGYDDDDDMFPGGCLFFRLLFSSNRVLSSSCVVESRKHKKFMLYGLRQRAVQTQHLTASFCSGEVTTRRNEYHKKYTVEMLLPS